MSGVSGLPSVNRMTAAQKAIAQLREAIVEGRLAPGAALGELQLVEQLGVGRAPIREALRQLAQEGLVTHEAHRGSAVVSLTQQDLADIYVAREAIERKAAECILELGPRADLSGVERAIAALREAPSGLQPSVARVHADVAFHESVVRAAGSERLHRMFRTLMAETQMYLLQTHPPYDSEAYVGRHTKLADAILELRPDAPQAMAQHLIEARTEILEVATDAAGRGSPDLDG